MARESLLNGELAEGHGGRAGGWASQRTNSFVREALGLKTLLASRHASGEMGKEKRMLREKRESEQEDRKETPLQNAAILDISPER